VICMIRATVTMWLCKNELYYPWQNISDSGWYGKIYHPWQARFLRTNL